MATVVSTKGGAFLGLLTGLGRALATGFSASKEVDEGCGSCPNDDDGTREQIQFRNPRIRYSRRRRRRR